MADGIYAALWGSVAQSHALDVTAHNLANLATPGFRAARAHFGEVLDRAAKAAADDGAAPRAPAGVIGTVIDPSQGVLTRSGNPLDVAIEGPGWFVVATSAGERLTRAGAFTLSPDRTLVTREGHAVLGEHGPIQVPADAGPVRIDDRGEVSAGERVLGTLRAVHAEPRDLVAEGATLHRAKDGAKLAPADPRFVQGAIEQSNVNALRGMGEVVRVSRAWEALQRVIETLHQTDRRAADLTRAG